jgi:ketosteroid isomerase-like protein
MPLEADDERAIHRLLTQYATAVSHSDVEGWVSLFTEDAVWERAEPAKGSMYNEYVRHEGHRSLRELATTSFAEQGQVQYLSANEIVEGDGNHATGTSTILVIKVVDAEASILVVGNFVDEYRRTPAGWRFRQRVIRLLG